MLQHAHQRAPHAARRAHEHMRPTGPQRSRPFWHNVAACQHTTPRAQSSRHNRTVQPGVLCVRLGALGLRGLTSTRGSWCPSHIPLAAASDARLGALGLRRLVHQINKAAEVDAAVVAEAHLARPARAVPVAAALQTRTCGMSARPG